MFERLTYREEEVCRMKICRTCGHAVVINAEMNLYQCKLIGRTLSGSCQCKTGQYVEADTKKPEKPKKSKYNNNRARVAGILFDSQKEAASYEELKMQLMTGEIAGFCRQAEFILQEGFANVKPITYKCDWIVFHNDGTYEIRDDKGMETEVFKIKHKMFMDKFPGLELKIVK